MYLDADSVWSGGTLDVDGELHLRNPITWNGGVTITGDGALLTEDTSIVAANTTINVHTFDWDGIGNPGLGFLQTINDGATFTLNIVNFDDLAFDDDMDAPINLGGNGAQLIISGPVQWIMNDTFTANTAGTGTATIGGTSRMVLTGTLHVNGNTTVSAPITFGAGSTTSIDDFAGLRLSGGNLTTNPNRLQGGVITGGGLSFLRADSGSALHGFGTINTLIDFDDAADLKADNRCECARDSRCGRHSQYSSRLEHGREYRGRCNARGRNPRRLDHQRQRQRNRRPWLYLGARYQ
jgi:hypothetical protein